MHIDFEKFTLKNGVRVIVAPMKGTEAITTQVLFGVGSRYEDKSNNGIAHFIEHMMFKGTKKRPTAMDITKEIDGVGGSFNAFTADEVTGYFIKFPKKKFELALDILSDMTINSKFEKKEIDKERGVILEEIKMRQDHPPSFAYRQIQSITFGDTPLGRWGLGTPKTVNSITREQMLDFYSKFYNPKNAVISIAGNVSKSKAKELVKKYFGKMKGKENNDYEKSTIVQKNPQIEIEKRAIEQSTIVMSFRSFKRDHKDRYTRALIEKALGGYFSSKLFSEIREKRGLAYVIQAETDPFHDTGAFLIGGGFDPAKDKKAIKAILEVLKEVKEKGFSAEEVNMGKENISGGLNLALESTSFIADYLGEQEVLDGKIRTPEEIIRKIKEVKNSDIKRIAKEMFRPENFNMIIVGPQDSKKQKEYLKLIKL